MIALSAGTGGLPAALVTSLAQRGEPAPLICEMRGFQADVPADLPRLPFRMETLGSFLADLRAQVNVQVDAVGCLVDKGQ